MAESKAIPAQPTTHDDLSTFEVATSRYFSKALIEESNLTPVGFTVGPPKFLSIDLVANLRALGPVGGLFKIEDEAEFRKLYRKHLDSIGVEAIANLLQAVAWLQPGTARHDGVVLLCFCKLEADGGEPGTWCHRQVFAEWWQEKTGQPVRELEADIGAGA